METKKEVKAQLKYMKTNREEYLKNISLEEYNKRITKLEEVLKRGLK